MRCFAKLLAYALFFCLIGSARLVYADGPYRGKVIDAETKQPIEGAAVLAVWWQRCPGIAQTVQAYYDSQETLTDQQGNFVIPGISAVPLSPYIKIDEPQFYIFRPGYEAIGGRRLKPAPPELQAYSKVKDNVYEENGIMVVEVYRLKMREERLRNLSRISISSRVPEEKYPNLFALKNIEAVTLGLKPIPTQKGQKQPLTDPSVKIIPRSQVGNIIEDGVGFGEIRIGSPETELLTKWGATALAPLPHQPVYHYLLDSGEGVLVYVKSREVRMIVLVPARCLPYEVKTTKGIGLMDSFERVTLAYGNPDSEKTGGLSFYTSQGVGFLRGGGFIGWIMVYEPGKLPELFEGK